MTTTYCRRELRFCPPWIACDPSCINSPGARARVESSRPSAAFAFSALAAVVSTLLIRRCRCNHCLKLRLGQLALAPRRPPLLCLVSRMNHVCAHVHSAARHTAHHAHTHTCIPRSGVMPHVCGMRCMRHAAPQPSHSAASIRPAIDTAAKSMSHLPPKGPGEFSLQLSPPY